MKKHLLVLVTSTLFFACNVFAASNQNDSNQQWQVSVFGQSTDLNFASLIKPEKIGTNNVYQTGQAQPLTSSAIYPLFDHITIESRGGKIANSHDGMTVFYRQIPATQTFVLKADVILEQLGPEVDGKTPAAQEAAGLFVRDVIGIPRQDPQPLGYEEFPDASNLLMNAFVTQNKKNDHLVQVTALLREGVTQPWGNQNITMTKSGYVKNVDYSNQRLMQLSIERTPEKFILTWMDPQSKESHSWSQNDYSGLMNQQDREHLYVGFFAARNAKIQVINAHLTFTDGAVNYSTLTTIAPTPKAIEPKLILNSPTTVYTSDYTLQMQANVDGKVIVKSATQEEEYPVQAGEYIQVNKELPSGKHVFSATFITPDKTTEHIVNVKHQTAIITNVHQIYVAPEGKTDATGTIDSPVDLITAIQTVTAGGTIYLNDGYYTGITIPAELSGLPDKLKTLQAINRHQAIFINDTFNLDSHYWHIDGVVFDGNIDNTDNQPAFLRIAGSNNIISNVIARNNSDTGIAITAKDRSTRALWPAYNLITHTDSYNNQDKSGINADGFAAKLGVGKGNIFSHCTSHHNADDGWDLFNKIEDGANEPVIIENSIAYENGRPFNKPNITKGSIGNGFKIGGEGQPVDHKIINSIAFNNNMDGFTDNFNTGSLSLLNNIALNNARYNYIIRSNPYAFLDPKVVFAHNLSIKNNWEDSIADSFGTQVHAQDNNTLTVKEYSRLNSSKPLQLPTSVSRDENGDIIYPEFFQ